MCQCSQDCDFAGCTGGNCNFHGSCGSSGLCTFGQCLGGGCTGWAGGTASDLPVRTAMTMGVGILILLVFVSILSLVGCVICVVCCLKPSSRSRQPAVGFVPISTVATVNAAYVPPPSSAGPVVLAQTYTPVHVAAQANTPQAAPAPMQTTAPMQAPVQTTASMRAPNSGSIGPGSATFVSPAKAPLKMPEV